MNKLTDFELITHEEYNKLDDPNFIGQTRVIDNKYYMCWVTKDGRLVKTESTLIPKELLKETFNEETFKRSSEQLKNLEV